MSNSSENPNPGSPGETGLTPPPPYGQESSAPRMYPPPPGYEDSPEFYPGASPAYPPVPSDLYAGYQGGTYPGYPPAPPGQSYPGYQPAPGQPYPAYPPYPYGMPYPPMRKGLPRWGWALIIIGFGLFVACIGVVIFAAVIGLGWRSDGLKTADAFMKAARAGNIEQMRAQLSPTGQQNYATTELQTILAQGKNFLPKYSSFTDTGFNMNTSGADIIMVLSGNARYEDGSTGYCRFELEQVGDKWLLRDVQIDPPTRVTRSAGAENLLVGARR